MTAYDDAKAALQAEFVSGRTTYIKPEAAANLILALTDASDATVNTLAGELAAFDGALIPQGNWDASAGTFPGSGSAAKGALYRVSVAGTVDSIAFTVGDSIYALVDDASTTVYAANWQKTEGIITTAEITAALGYTAANDAALNASNLTSGTVAAARGGAGTISGILKANGAGVVSAATSATDYAPATSGSAILKGNGAGGFSAASAGTDYQGVVTAALLSAFAFGPFTTIASATTTDLSTVATIGVSISGVTTITGFGTGANLLRIGKFAGILTLTHNATSLILPGGSNITTAAGDRFIAMSDGSGNWTVVVYTKADGSAVVAVSAGVATYAGRSGTVTVQADDYAAFIGCGMPLNYSIAASVSGNALTLALKDAAGSNASATSPIEIGFRSTTLTSGAPVIRAVTGALSVVVPSGQAVGTANSTPSRLWLLALDNGGTVELAVVNCLTSTGVFPLNEAALATTTAIASAPSAGVMYSTTARTSKAIRILGYVEYTSGLATAGTWSAAPDIVQLFGPGIKRPGEIVQMAYTETGAASTGTTTIPADDTIPQNTEGTQFMSLAVTPTAKSNLLMIESNIFMATSGTVWATAALYQDSTANALAAISAYLDTANGHITAPLGHHMVAATTSATTFKVRAGPSGAATMTLNGNSGSRQLGGVIASFMRIQEVMA